VLERAVQAVDSETDAPFLFVTRANILQAAGKTDDAVGVLVTAMKAYPKAEALYITLGTLYRKSERHDDARGVYENGLNVLPRNETLLRTYAEHLNDHFAPKLALWPYNRLLAIRPERTDYLTLRGNVYLQLGLYDAAMRDYKRANGLANGAEGWILGNIGNLYNNRGLYCDAIDYLKKSLIVEPDSQYSHERLGNALKNSEEEQNKVTKFETEADSEIRAAAYQRRSDQK
jgi:tetratricopeptide (TPR) repeat protein